MVFLFQVNRVVSSPVDPSLIVRPTMQKREKLHTCHIMHTSVIRLLCELRVRMSAAYHMCNDAVVMPRVSNAI